MLPYHDSRFRGYGYNKVVHALLLSKQKYKFKVLSNPFLIHDGIKEETSGQSKAEQELNTKESFINSAFLPIFIEILLQIMVSWTF